MLNGTLTRLTPFVVVVAMLISAGCSSTASNAPDSNRTSIYQIAEEDQKDRQTSEMSIKEMAARDAVRRAQVLSLLSAGKILTSDDYYYAALVFQHGETTDDAKTAFALASIARALPRVPKSEESEGHIQWLPVAAWDRLMMRYKQPQWYGTQYVASSDRTQWILYDFNSSIVTEDERKIHLLDPVSEIDKAFPRKARPQE